MASNGSIQLGSLRVEDFTDIYLTGFDPGTESVETSDLNNPVFDDTYAGVDMFRAPTWTFTIDVKGRTAAEVLERVDRVKRVWRNPAWAKKGGELAELRYTLAGRDRVVYGRPRRFACNPTVTSRRGYAVITADFQLMDPLIYDHRWQSVRLDMVPAAMRGLKEPLVEPLSTGGFSQRQGVIGEVGGTAPTPFMIDITAGSGGLIANPFVSINNNRYEFVTEVREGRTLRVDSRKGTAGVGSTNVLSTMRKRTRLKSVRLPNGAVEVSFGGVNPALDSYATFWWRPAYYSL